ncbi:ABC transporter permease [Shewanella sp. NIFS-20-20]|uniref:ABC transporter permease n=1 Tax=Shewanella sp. NIFS-20-20 TaxID=2853806 RepID=UPI001C47E54C|nr:hypothetical protein [Shewanella sp. NIFS-20-20]MBV7316011.1 hypothetical protein [Shewanella sp. NIFS-20-20]
MMSTDVVFETVSEWRRWRGLKIKLLIMLLGFGLALALLTLVMKLGSLLFFENPRWVNTSQPLYTVGRLHSDYRLDPINLQAVRKISELSVVEQVSSLAIKSMDFNLAGTSLPAAQTAFLSNNFTEHLLTDFTVAGGRGVWLTEQYWQQAFAANKEVAGQFLSHKRIPSDLPILGVLPPQFNMMANHKIDIWASSDLLEYTTPFGPGPIADKFLLAAPIHYAVFTAKREFPIDQLTKQVNALDVSVKGMGMPEAALSIAVLKGLQLDPKSHQQLLSLWYLLILLTLALFGVLVFGLLTLATNKALNASHEYRTLEVLGANRGHFLLGSAGMSVMVMLVVTAISLLSLPLLLSLVTLAPSVQVLAGGASITIAWPVYWQAWLAVWLVILIVFVTTTLRLNTRTLFSRARQQGRSRWQMWFAQGLLVLLMTTTISICYFLAQIAQTQWQAYQQTNIDLEVKQLDVVSSDSLAPLLDAISLGHHDHVSASLQSFAEPTRISIKHSNLTEPQVFAVMSVSPQYFKVLAIETSAELAQGIYGVVINQTAANLLYAGDQSALLAGTIPLFFEEYPIVGTVADIPHWGKSHQSLPTIYFPINLRDFQDVSRLSIQFSDDKARALIQPYLNNAGLTSLSPVMTLGEVIDQLDRFSYDLLLFSGLVIVIFMLSTNISLWHQSQNRVMVQTQELSILMALGSDDAAILWRMARQYLLAFSGACLIAISVLQVFANDLGAAEVEVVILAWVIVIVFVVGLVAVLHPVIKLFNQPLQQSLHEV